MGRSVSRRAVLAAVVAVPTAPVLAGCADDRSAVRVATVFSGTEQIAFQRVLAAFTRLYGRKVVVISVASDIMALLYDPAPPDVVILPMPGAVRQAARDNRLAELDDQLVTRTPDSWRRLVTFDGASYGVWFKVAHKSLVWYRPEVFTQHGVYPPASWADWVQANETLRRTGLAPLALGAASGWVLSDWFENVLLDLDHDAYRRLAETGRGWDDPNVRETLRRLARMWGQPGTFSGGARRALLTDFEESVVDVFYRGRAAMVAEGDFTYSVINRFAKPDAGVDWFTFPARFGSDRRIVVGGDVAVLTRPATPGGQDLVAWLSSAAAAEIWATEGGFISLNPGVPAASYPDVYGKRLLDNLDTGTKDGIFFDLSDQLTGWLGGGEGRGLWRILQDFLAAIGDRGEDIQAVTAAVDRTVDLLSREANRPLGQ
jgi:ABC-type glycerol-3-phosphate transport system substrate-binding protein